MRPRTSFGAVDVRSYRF